MTRGQPREIILTPVHTPVLDRLEAVTPFHIELRNGRLTPTGHWKRRPGFAPQFLLFSPSPVTALIPDGGGYATLANGKVFRLTPLTKPIPGYPLEPNRRPTFVNYAGTIVLANGGPLLKIVDDAISPVGGFPPQGPLIATVDTYLVIAGHRRLQFNWSQTNTFETYPPENFNSLLDEGQALVAMRTLRRELYFFTTRSVEVWTNVGGDQTFVRRGVVERGAASGESVVQANDSFYWLGQDGFLYCLEGGVPKVIPRKFPRQMETVLARINDKASVYGFDFRQEATVRWIAPTEGLCIAYDYANDLLSLESQWTSGGEQGLPINSHTELAGFALVGDTGPTGVVNLWSTQYRTDNGLPIRVAREFRVRLSEASILHRVNQLRLRLKRGDPPGGAKLLLRWALDEADYGPYQELDLGQVGERGPYVDIYNLGLARELSFELVETDAVDYLVLGATLTAEPLLN